MEITFHAILGSTILILILLFVLRTLFLLNAEGFENILTAMPTGKDITNLCPANETLVYQLLNLASGTTPATFKYACYAQGVTNVDPTFMNDNVYLYVSTPKDYTASLYSAKDTSGTLVLELSEKNTMTNDICSNDRYCIGDTNKTPNMKFASIKVSKKVVTKTEAELKEERRLRRLRRLRRMRKNSLNQFYTPSTCPGLSPAAAAAAAAADAKSAADAKKAANLAALVSSALVKSGGAGGISNSGLSITCPSGDDPILNEGSARNTKFSAKKNKNNSMYDESCGSNEYIFNPETEN